MEHARNPWGARCLLYALVVLSLSTSNQIQAADSKLAAATTVSLSTLSLSQSQGSSEQPWSHTRMTFLATSNCLATATFDSCSLSKPATDAAKEAGNRFRSVVVPSHLATKLCGQCIEAVLFDSSAGNSASPFLHTVFHAISSYSPDKQQLSRCIPSDVLASDDMLVVTQDSLATEKPSTGSFRALYRSVDCSSLHAAEDVDSKPASLQTRRLLQNPDLPSQRQGKVEHKEGDSSPAPQPQAAQQDNQPQQSDNIQTSSSGALDVYVGGFRSGWSDSSYGIRAFTTYDPPGRNGGTARCGILPRGSALSFFGPSGSFAGRKALEFWVFQGASLLPAVDVALVASDGNECKSVNFASMSVAEYSSGWVKFWVPLNDFSWDSGMGGGQFVGCGSQVLANNVVKLDLRNNNWYNALICLDDIRIMP